MHLLALFASVISFLGLYIGVKDVSVSTINLMINYCHLRASPRGSLNKLLTSNLKSQGKNEGSSGFVEAL